MEKALKIVTFNVRQPWDWAEDGVNSFIHRAGMVLTKIDEEKADIIAFQEVKPEQKYFFEKYLTDYHVYARGRNVDLEGEGLAIAFRKDTVEMLSADCFWLSPTPYVPGSRFQNQSDCPRICLSATVRRKGDSHPFRIYNIHLDHESEDARVTQMKCLLEHIAEDQKKINLPMLLMGDFNALPSSETIKYIDTYKALSLQEMTQDISATFHGFGKSKPHVKYDYIYTDPDTAKKIKSVETWADVRNGIYLSDHFPIGIMLEF
jgi:endonuclease/exonuclease/phosphatase family metal-dependent hydrolase